MPASPAPSTAPAGPRTGPAPPPTGRVVLVVALTAFGLLLLTLCLPSMQEWGELFGASQTAVQLTFSAYGLAFGAMQAGFGPLSDRLGRRPVLLVGLALAAAGSLLAALAPSLPVLIAARALQGAGTAAGAVSGRATVQDWFSGPQRTRVMAYIGMAMGLSPPLATVLGGQLHVRLGWQSNFWLAGAMAVLLWVAVWRWMPARPASDAAAARGSARRALREMTQGYARLLREREFLLYVAILSSTIASFYAFLAGAPIVLKSYGIGPDRVGFTIMAVPISYIAGNFLTSRLVRRHGERRLMAIGQALSIAGIALLLVLGLAGQRSAVGFAAPLLLMGVGNGLMTPTVLARTVGLLPALAGTAAAVAGVAQQLTGAFGGLAVGWLRHDGPAQLAALMLAFALAAAAAQALLPEPAPAREAGPAA